MASSSQQQLLSARSQLASKLDELSLIQQKLLLTQSRLTGIDHSLPLIQAAIAPIRNKASIAKDLSSILDVALDKAEALLDIFDSIRFTQKKLAADDPQSDLRKYLAMVCHMESYLQSIREEYTPSVDLLENAVRFLGKTRSLDAYNLQKLSLEVAESKKIDPWSEFARKDPLGMAMQKLETEFERLFSADCKTVDLSVHADAFDSSESSSSPRTQHRAAAISVALELMSRDTINKLLVISDRLNANGRIGDCLDFYIKARTRVTRKSMATLRPDFLRSFSVESLNASKWDTIQESLGAWLTDVKVIVSVFMAAERELCDQVFHALEPAERVSCFAEIVKQSNISVFFRYAEAVASTEHRPEAMLVGLLYIINGLKFSMEPGLYRVFESCKQTIADIESMKRILAKNVYKVFVKLVKNVEVQATKVPSDGGKDQNASFVVNYMGMIMRDYREAMEEALEIQKKGKGESLVAMAAMSMMEALEKSMEGRAGKLYEDSKLGHIFLMNNHRHVLARLDDCRDLSECLGEEFRVKWNNKVEFHRRSYMKLSWDKAMSNLELLPSSPSPSSSLHIQTVKARYRSFQQAFDEICRLQRHWIILDPDLRDRVHSSIIDMLLPAYTAFIRNYSSFLDDSQQQRITRYTPDSLRIMVRDLFQGAVAR